MEADKINYCLKHIHNEKSFDALYSYFFPRIVRHLKRKFFNKISCEDVAQECFRELLKKTDFKEVEFPTSYIYKICDRLAFDKSNVTEIDLEKSQSNLIFTENFDFEVFGELQHLIDAMDDTTKKLMYYTFAEGYSLKECAELLNINYDAARQRHARGLKKLKEDYKKEKKRR